MQDSNQIVTARLSRLRLEQDDVAHNIWEML